jgi:pimeloyl-ACP methyl ester carboxylesterase
MDAIEAGDLLTAASIASPSCYSEAGYFDLAEDFIKEWFRYGDDVAREWLTTFHGPAPELDIKALLPKVRTPTLVTQGTEDRRVPYETAEYIARRIPRRGPLSVSGPGTRASLHRADRVPWRLTAIHRDRNGFCATLLEGKEGTLG